MVEPGDCVYARARMTKPEATIKKSAAKEPSEQKPAKPRPAKKASEKVEAPAKPRKVMPFDL